MLIKAIYEKDKIKVLHAQNVSHQIRYCNDLAKDRSNGFTKGRSLRRIGSFPDMVLKEYDRLHPGWMDRAQCGTDFDVKEQAWREFLDSNASKPFMTVEKMLH